MLDAKIDSGQARDKDALEPSNGRIFVVGTRSRCDAEAAEWIIDDHCRIFWSQKEGETLWLRTDSRYLTATCM